MIYAKLQLCADANIITIILKIDNLSSSFLCIYRSLSGNRQEYLTIIMNTMKHFNGQVKIIEDINLNITRVDYVDNE